METPIQFGVSFFLTKLNFFANMLSLTQQGTMKFFYTEKTREAAQMAIKAHAEQLDKAGFPYFIHLYNVAEKAETEEECIVGILHDILEDISWDYAKEIREKFGNEIADAVEAISRRPDEKYKDYIERVCANKIAKNVKLYDLIHNLNHDRMAMTTDIGNLLERYEWTYKRLFADN